MNKLPAKKNWHSLSQLRDYILEHHLDEEVIRFVGYELVTNYATYKLGPDGLIVEPKES